MTALLVFLGAGLGGVARYSIGTMVHQAARPDFPWGTLIVNVTGSLLLGFLFMVMDQTPSAATWRGPWGAILPCAARRAAAPPSPSPSPPPIPPRTDGGAAERRFERRVRGVIPFLEFAVHSGLYDWSSRGDTEDAETGSRTLSAQ